MATLRDLRQLETDLLSKGGKIDSEDLRTLKEALYTDGRIDRKALDMLADFRRRIVRPGTPAFGTFFNKAVKDHVLQDGKIGAEEADWLRELVFRDGKVQDEEKTLLRELRGEAKAGTSPEFEALLLEVEKHPDEHRTSGGGRS